MVLKFVHHRADNQQTPSGGFQQILLRQRVGYRVHVKTRTTIPYIDSQGTGFFDEADIDLSRMVMNNILKRIRQLEYQYHLAVSSANSWSPGPESQTIDLNSTNRYSSLVVTCPEIPEFEPVRR